MILGFTGSRHGPTEKQYEAMRYFLGGMPMTRFVHGAAVGCDKFAHDIVRRFHGDIVIELHPLNIGFRSTLLTIPMGNCEIYPELPPLVRNRVIVSRIHGLLAVPATDVEADSGTWATVREARKLGVPIYVARRSGRLVRDKSMRMIGL